MLKSLEWVVVGTASAGFALYCYRSGGVVWGSDMLHYLEVGLGRVTDPFILYRYTHVYALRLASIMAGSTLRGTHAYSGIAGGLAVALTYYSSRNLRRDSSIFNGLIAALLLLTIPLVVKLFLAPSVDTTLMLIILAFVALYTSVAPGAQFERVLLAGMGVLFILGIRTKEVAWVLLGLLPGLLVGTAGNFESAHVKKRLRPFIVGVVLGIALMILANFIFVDSPLFGLRPTDIADHWEMWSGIIGSTPRTASSVYQLLLMDRGALFVLFVAAGLSIGPSVSTRVRLIWLFPLLLIGFLIVATTREGWTIVPRGFLPGLAVMAILAGNVFTIQAPLRPRSTQWLVAALLVVVGFALFGQLTRGDLPVARYFELALGPVMIGIVLGMKILVQDRKLAGLAIFSVLLPFATYSAWLNVSSVAAEVGSTGYRTRFVLPLALQDKIDLSDPFSAYVSRSAIERLSGVANTSELAGIFNVALDGYSQSSDYRIGSVDEPLIEAMEMASYEYVVVTLSEWDWLRTAPQDRPEWRDKYEAFEEPSGRYVLLMLRADQRPGEGT